MYLLQAHSRLEDREEQEEQEGHAHQCIKHGQAVEYIEFVQEDLREFSPVMDEVAAFLILVGHQFAHQLVGQCIVAADHRLRQGRHIGREEFLGHRAAGLLRGRAR